MRTMSSIGLGMHPLLVFHTLIAFQSTSTLLHSSVRCMHICIPQYSCIRDRRISMKGQIVAKKFCARVKIVTLILNHFPFSFSSTILETEDNNIWYKKPSCRCFRGTAQARCQLKSGEILHKCSTDCTSKGLQPGNDMTAAAVPEIFKGA